MCVCVCVCVCVGVLVCSCARALSRMSCDVVIIPFPQSDSEGSLEENLNHKFRVMETGHGGDSSEESDDSGGADRGGRDDGECAAMLSAGMGAE